MKNFNYKLKSPTLCEVFDKNENLLGTLSIIHDCFRYYHHKEVSEEEHKEIANKILDDILSFFISNLLERNCKVAR